MTEMLPILAIAAVVVALAAAAALVVVVRRGRNPAAEPHAAAMAELAQAQGATAQRLEAMIRMLGDRQSQLQTAVNERLESVSHRLAILCRRPRRTPPSTCKSCMSGSPSSTLRRRTSLRSPPR